MVKVLTNQTLFQCEYCEKRLLTKHGAELHETSYCKESPVVQAYDMKEKLECDHTRHTVYGLISGEDYVQEPLFDRCIECGVTEMELDEIKGELK